MSMIPSNAVRECLEGAGWSPDRRIDVSGFESAMRAEGLTITEPAIRFLSEFGGLTVRYPPHRVRPRSYDYGFHFVADRAAANAQVWRLREYEEAIRSRLTVIGEAFTDHFTLVMDESGAVYGGFEDVLVRLGNSGVDAIIAIIEGSKGERVKYDLEREPTFNGPKPLSDEATKRLSAGGWHHGRDVSIPHAIAGHSAEQVFGVVIDFLREFGGISIECPAWAHVGSKDVCRFTADSVRSLPAAHFPEYRRKIGMSVTAIGEFAESQLVLLMGEDGRVFAGMRELPDILWLVGDSGCDAINNLCGGVPCKRYL